MLDERRAYGIVGRIEREDAPMIVLKAEIARTLPLRAAPDAKVRQDVIEITKSAREHLVVAIERERAFRSDWPFARLVGEARIGHAEEVRPHLRWIADIIDVAEMDRVVGPEGPHARGDVEGLVG